MSHVLFSRPRPMFLYEGKSGQYLVVFNLSNSERTNLSEYCTILPFLDQEIHFGPVEYGSVRFNARMTRGDSFEGAFATLQTRRSPSMV
jgi:hypothetical protein